MTFVEMEMIAGPGYIGQADSDVICPSITVTVELKTLQIVLQKLTTKTRTRNFLNRVQVLAVIYFAEGEKLDFEPFG